MGCTQGRRRNRFHSWPTPQNAIPNILYPSHVLFPSSLSLSSRTTFDSAKFETSFHATLPLFHVGRDAYKGDGGGSLSRNSKRPLLLLPLFLSSFLFLHCTLMYILLSSSITGVHRYRISVDVWQNFFSMRIREKNSFIQIDLVEKRRSI